MEIQKRPKGPIFQ